MRKIVVFLIGITEILIGLCTCLTSLLGQMSLIPGLSLKPVNVYVFVLITAAASMVLGVALIAGRDWARTLLIFFSGYVILTKLLIYGGLLSLQGQALVIVPVWAKDGISALYHLFVLVFLACAEKPLKK